MNTFQRIKMLAKQRGLSIAELERKLNLSNGSISRWKSAAPSSKGLVAIADYFDVSVDYLLGREKEEYEGEKDSARGVIAAHIDDDVTEEELQEIVDYIEFRKRRRRELNND